MKNILEVKDVTKSFGTTRAVNELSLTVEKGQLYAFLGTNGAGKSTTISMICGNMKLDSGNIVVCGKDISTDALSVKKEIGVVFQDSVLDGALTVYDNLKFRAGLYGITGLNFIKKYHELEQMFELNEIKNQSLKKLSGGQRRRVDVARALVHSPQFLILDEPTTGLDPSTRKKIWKIIDSLRNDLKITVLLTTHYMEEAAKADYVSIIAKGKLVAEGTVLDLKNKYTYDNIVLYDITEKEVKILEHPYVQLSDTTYKIKVTNTEEVTALIVKHQNIFKDYEVIKGNMDDVFLAATGSTTEEEV